MAKVTFKGGKDLERALLALAKREADKIGRKAVREAAKPILTTARANVPVRQGRLKRSLQIKVDRDRARGQRRPGFIATIKVSGRLGYRPRKTNRRSRVKGKLGPARANYQIGTRPDIYGAFQEFGIHGRPRPFLRPAWDAEGGSVAIERMGKAIWIGLDQFARRER